MFGRQKKSFDDVRGGGKKTGLGDTERKSDIIMRIGFVKKKGGRRTKKRAGREKVTEPCPKGKRGGGGSIESPR